MLNRNKVLSQLNQIVPKIYDNTAQELELAKYCWEFILNNIEISETISKIKSTEYPIPSWQDNLNFKNKVTSKTMPYQVISVDGSQIYPDRHQGIGCYLINLGIANLFYSQAGSQVKFDSIPYIFADSAEQESPEIINCKRSGLELEYGLKITSKVLIENSNIPTLFICDGSLIFWHLEGKDDQIKQNFLTNYLYTLDQFYQKKILIAGFISLPKSKDLINIIRLGLKNNLILKPDYINNSNIEYLVDTDLLYYLDPFYRTALFVSNSAITQFYPNHLKPHFIYLNIENEIVRIEIPAWIAQDNNYLNTVLEIILDQCIKGRGYPIALAEAHEQAVVKNCDRDFFYQILSKVSFNHNRIYKASQKSLRKRQIGI